jgi:hypothetical protein
MIKDTWPDDGQSVVITMDNINASLVDSVKHMKELGRGKAEAERDYKRALREAIITMRLNDNVAWTACSDLALGMENVSELRYRRDVYESDYECAKEKIYILKLRLRTLMDQQKLDYADHE